MQFDLYSNNSILGPIYLVNVKKVWSHPFTAFFCETPLLQKKTDEIFEL